MYRIRFHGRGGQGIKTASRILGSAFFVEGFEVQDAPRYGAERRGAPIFAYVRASDEPVFERGPIHRPDLVVVADASLIQVPAAGVLLGLTEQSVLLIATHEKASLWRERLNTKATLLTLSPGAGAQEAATIIGAACAGAAARLLGVVGRASLESAIRTELERFTPDVVLSNLERAMGAYDEMASHEGSVTQADRSSLKRLPRPEWVDLATETPRIATPMIREGPTSGRVETGLWRTQRPIVDYEHCNRCSWICSTLCPDGAIAVGDDREPIIDYDHCKGCLICAAVCPPHAIRVEPESGAHVAEEGGAVAEETSR
jgi:pyruvate ferredoxin oxidoreductase gamma subunit